MSARSRRRLLLAAALAVFGFAALPHSAWAGTWYVNGTLDNNSGQTLSFGPQTPALIDGQWGTSPGVPPTTVPSGSEPLFAFTAPNFDEGADMYADYQLANGDGWELTAEDDESSGGGSEPTGNYVGCAEPAAQGAPGSNPVCSAEWGGTYENMTPVYYFGTGPPMAAAGQTCEAAFTWPSTYDCTQAGLIAPVDPHNPMALTFQNTGNQPTYVEDDANDSNCRMQTAGSQCTIITSGTGYDHIVLGAVNQNSSSQFQFSVQIVAETDGPTLLQQGAGLAIWPWNGTPGGSSSGSASGWQINPKIFNHTGSSAANCGSGSQSTGCVVLDGDILTDGNWTNGGPGATYVPNGGSSFPFFDAPYFNEGADGYWAYTMPDGNQYGVGAQDNENGFGIQWDSSPGCTAQEGQSNQFICVAKFSPGGSASPTLFNSDVDFYPGSSWADYPTAAGEMCAVPGGSTNYACAPALTCPTAECTISDPNGGGWGVPDTSNVMLLGFYDVSSSGTLRVTDPNASGSCLMGPGATCVLQTHGPIVAGGKTDALNVNYSTPSSPGTTAEVEVLTEAEINPGVGGAGAAEFNNILNNIISGASEADGNVGDTSYGGDGGDDAVGARRPGRELGDDVRPTRRSSERRGVPTPVHLAVDVRPRRRPSASGAAPTSRIDPASPTLSYRLSSRGPTVLTLDHATAGVLTHGSCRPSEDGGSQRGRSCSRWVPVGHARTLTSREYDFDPSASHPCPPGAPRTAAGLCAMKVTLAGWLRHDGVPGRNQLSLGGPPLAAGRYRVTLRALTREGASKPVSRTFQVPSVRLGCNTPIGEISANTLGSVSLGASFQQAKTIYGCGEPGRDADRYRWRFRQGSGEIATASPSLVRAFAPNNRRAVAGKVVLALTSSEQLHLATIRVGSTAASVRARFPRHIAIAVGADHWYVIPQAHGSDLIEMRGGRVRDLGIATRSLADDRQHALLLVRGLA